MDFEVWTPIWIMCVFFLVFAIGIIRGDDK